MLFPGNLKAILGYTYLWARDIENNKALKYRPRHNFTGGIDFATRGFGVGIYFRYSSKVEEIDADLVNLGIVTDGELRVPVYVTDAKLSYELISLEFRRIFT
jgi:outer membrane receptor for ferrienterochelin and colicins